MAIATILLLLSELSALISYNVIITPLTSGKLEIIPPSGHIIPPALGLHYPALRSTASVRRDIKAPGRSNVSLWRFNFHCL